MLDSPINSDEQDIDEINRQIDASVPKDHNYKRKYRNTYRQTSGIQAKGVQTKVHVRIPDFT
jgi:hypothetical protein